MYDTNTHTHTHTYYQEVVMDISTLMSIACSAGVVLTVAPLSQGNGEDICRCDSVTISDR